MLKNLTKRTVAAHTGQIAAHRDAAHRADQFLKRETETLLVKDVEDTVKSLTLTL